MLGLTSCNSAKVAYLPQDSEWAKPYEESIDNAQNCEQLLDAYHLFCKKIIQCDSISNKEEWKTYCKMTSYLQRKMNRKARKFCGYNFFDNIIDATGGNFEEKDEDSPYDEWDPEEDANDYDEFDSTRWEAENHVCKILENKKSGGENLVAFV